jgi:peptide/nickel transport system permease protein/oligopeptide transport system permease protein
VTTVSLLVLIYLVSNLVVDVLYAVLDPRIRHD